MYTTVEPEGAADGREDPRLDAVSTLPVSTLRRLSALCDTGGVVAAQAALSQLALAAGLPAVPVRGAKTLGSVGGWTPEHGVTCPLLLSDQRPRVLVASGLHLRGMHRITVSTPLKCCVNSLSQMIASSR